MKILAIAIKDLTRSLRSLFLLGMAIAAPLVITLLMYFALGSFASGDVSLTPIRVGVVNQDRLPPAAPLETPLGASVRAMFFDQSVADWIDARDLPDEAAARAALNAAEIGVAVIIPPDFTAAYLSGNRREIITILQDPTLTIAPTVVRDMVVSLLDGVAGGGIAYETINARLAETGGSLDPSVIPALFERYAAWYAAFQRAFFHSPDQAALVVRAPVAADSTAGGFQTIFSLLMVGQLIFFSFFTAAYAMNSILEEAEEGTLARLFTTPTNRTAILAGKYLAVFLTVLLQGGVMLLLGRLLFDTRWGAATSLLLALLGQVFAAVGLAVLLVSLIKTSRQSGFIFGGGLTALGMLSGLFTTNIAMPESFNAIAAFTPQGWALKAWKVSIAGQPPGDAVVPFLVLLGMGLVMFSIGAVFFRRRFA
ncbi:MAG: ABC transporter permease [Bellilinea sp.]|jgi:ABC-type multidrug transport system permease subunit